MTEFWRIVHIFSAVVWVGVASGMMLFVTPAARRVGDQAQPFMRALGAGKLSETLAGAAVLTVLSGLFLYFSRFRGVVFSGRSGFWLTVGALAGIGAAIVGGVYVVRSNIRMRALDVEIADSGGPPTSEQLAEMGVLRRRLQLAGPPLLALFAVALLGMAIGG